LFSGGSSRRGRGLFRRLLWLSLFWLNIASKAFVVRFTPDSVRLCVFNRRRVALHANSERDGEVKCLFVGQSKLFCKFMDSDLLRRQRFLGLLWPCRDSAGVPSFHTGKVSPPNFAAFLCSSWATSFINLVIESSPTDCLSALANDPRFAATSAQC
jgi:hypothetical protein